MFRVATKIKRCRLGLLSWSRQQDGHAAKKIKEIQEAMEVLQQQGGQRDWNQWHCLNDQMDEAYKAEEEYWSQKARVQWLQEREKNTQFFHFSTVQIRKHNIIELLDK